MSNHLSQAMFRLAEARFGGPIGATVGGTENLWRDSARCALKALLGANNYDTEMGQAYCQSPSDPQAFANLYILFAVVLESEGL